MMSSPRNLTGGAADVVRYVRNERTLAPDGQEGKTGYYSQGGAPSSWSGALAAELGLKGPVSDRDLLSLLNGRVPGGERFAKPSRDRRMGVDIEFSAPKGVSLAALASDLPEEAKAAIIQAHHDAVAEAQSYVEREVLCARYGKGGAEAVKTGKALWATFLHEDARPVDGKVTPHLHSHGLLMNVTRGRDGDLRALDLQFGEVGIKLGGAIYRARLAAKLRALGHELRKTKDGFDLASVTDEQIRAASPRSGQIEARLGEQGLTRDTATAAQKEAAQQTTRESKSTLSRMAQLWEWRDLARKIGLAIPSPDPSRLDVATPPEDAARDALQYATDHLAERESVISSQAARLHALNYGVLDGVTDDVLFATIESSKESGDLFAVAGDRLVTRETLERENAILTALRAGRGTHEPLTSADGAAAIAAFEKAKDFQLTDGQRAAVALALTTTDQTVGVVGAAGAGKTTAMELIAAQAQAKGYEVVGLGPSQTAADGLVAAGCDDVRTLASFCERQAQVEPGPRFIILDEAGMASARDAWRLLQKIRPQDRLVLIGDPKQLAAIEAGSPFAQAMKEKAIAWREILEISRQKDLGLLAVATAFAEGRNEEAVTLAARYMTVAQVAEDDYRRVAEVPPEQGPNPLSKIKATTDMLDLMSTLAEREHIDPPKKRDFLSVRQWLDKHARNKLGTGSEQDPNLKAPPAVKATAIARRTAREYLNLTPEERAKTLVLSSTNAVRRDINSFIREGLQSAGAVSLDAVTVTALDKTQLTRAQLREAVNYQTGMVLRVTEGRGRRQTVTDYRLTVTDPTKNTVTGRAPDGTEKTFKTRDLDPKRATLYQPRALDLSVGDRVLFTENNRAVGFQNNETGTVLATSDRGIEIQKDGGETVTLDPTQRHTLDHGWAVTVHRSQGRTIDRALVAGLASKVATAASAYVACTRERWHLQIITDNTKKLQKAWVKIADRQTAREAMAEAGQSEVSTLDTARAQVRDQTQAHEPAAPEKPMPARRPEPARGPVADFELEM